jgi:2-methylcitrate dehydratase PrpD
MTAPADLAFRIAERVVAGAWESTPAARTMSTHAIVDCLGVMLAGAREPASRIAADVAVAQVPSGPATLIGHRASSGSEWAALVNGVSAHVLDFDDSHHPGMAHPTAVLLPAVLAVGEPAEASGREVIDAHLAGLRVIAALGSSVNPDHYLRGWHATSTLGALAAAVAASHLIGLDAQRLAEALGIAASQSSGVRRNFGSMAKSFHAGWAAHAGVMAARLAEAGMTAGAQVLEGRGGWLDVMVGNSDGRGDAILSALDVPVDEAASGVSLKQFASCGSTHTPLEAVLHLRSEHGIVPEDVVAVECSLNEAAFSILQSTDPASGLEAKFSLEFSLAVALVDGAAGLTQFTDARIADPAVRSLARRVTSTKHRGSAGAGARPDDWAAEVTISLRDGRRVTHAVERRRGGFGFEPLRRDERLAKFSSCVVESAFSRDDSRSLFAALEAIEDCDDVRVLVASLGPGER